MQLTIKSITLTLDEKEFRALKLIMQVYIGMDRPTTRTRGGEYSDEETIDAANSLATSEDFS